MNEDDFIEPQTLSIDSDEQIGESSESFEESVSEFAEPIEEETESEGINVWERLMATDPNPPLETVESPWNPELGGYSRVYRGIMKIGDIEGMPAVADLLIGCLEVFSEQSLEQPETDESRDDSHESDREEATTQTFESKEEALSNL